MGWFLRALLWATVLAWPCWRVMEPWQRAIGFMTAGILRLVGLEVAFDDVAMAAPMDVGLFLALGLSTPGGRRHARRFVTGVLLLVGGQIGILLASIGLYLLAPGDGAGNASALRWTGYLLESVPWINAAALWWVLLGREVFGAALGLAGGGNGPRGSGRRPDAAGGRGAPAGSRGRAEA